VLVVLHLPRLRRMVRIYLDQRLAARVDPSDVVQDALGDAMRARVRSTRAWKRRFNGESG
jgi:DNA-directed RNA polymerase specialized sigma24 family protein